MLRAFPVVLALFLVSACAGIFQDNLDAILESHNARAAAAREARIAEAQKAEEEAWDYSRETDLLTDRVNTTAIVGDPGGVLYIRCSGGDLWAVMWSKSTVHAGDRIRVRYRIDERPAVQGEWSWDWWNTMATLEDPYRFARAVSSATDRVVLRLEGDMEVGTHVFPVGRATETISRVLVDCGLR